MYVFICMQYVLQLLVVIVTHFHLSISHNGNSKGKGILTPMSRIFNELPHLRRTGDALVKGQTGRKN